MAVVGVIAVVAIGGGLYLLGRSPAAAVLPSSGPSAVAIGTPSSITAVAATPVATTRVSYGDLRGWIVFEHFGLALDGSMTKFDENYRTIWLVHADGSGLHELAPDKPAQGKFSPDISPDGTKVVFATWMDSPSLYEAPIDGGDPHTLPTCGDDKGCVAAHPAYSADGSRVGFVKADFASKPPTVAIAILDLASSKTTVLEKTRVDLGKVNLSQMTWSADGKEIAYNHEPVGADGEPTNSSIFIASTDGTAVRQLTNPKGLPAGDPEWSPDGSRIVFTTSPGEQGENGAWSDLAIYTVRPDDSDLRLLCRPCDSGGVHPSWTADGLHILFYGYRSWDLMDPDGMHPLPINRAKLTWAGETHGYSYLARLQPTF
jgi:TolB protein